MLDKLNQFTRREHSADEVFIFDVILCDNDTDRDYEAFSDNSLEKMQRLFIGKTGIFDHNPKGSNQTARIFDTEIVTDNSKKSASGSAYKYLKASAYMVRTDSNADLIKEIDGGIKKEVSVSCSASKRICSICGADKNTNSCMHIKGRKYGGKLCFHILDDITDAYEWSFVAVPAQVCAGVSRKFFGSDDDSYQLIKSYEDEISQKNKIIDVLYSDLKRDVSKLCFINSSACVSDALMNAVEKMDISELADFKHKLIKEKTSLSAKPQLMQKNSDALSDFRMREGR
ncbi:MAG: hypothetical protein ACI4JM_04040 [Oscillospiraceae bacterium]